MKQILKSLYQYSRNEEIKKIIIYTFSIKPEVRYWVAHNPKTPIFILEKLSKDENFYVRLGVAKNQNTPAHLLKKLLKDEDPDACYYSSRNLELKRASKNT